LEDLPAKVQPSGSSSPLADPEPERASSPIPPVAPVVPGADFKTRVRRFETGLIEAALRRTGGNKTEAALLLKIPCERCLTRSRPMGSEPERPAHAPHRASRLG
jgi:DNA-binding NtrC family response regulator